MRQSLQYSVTKLGQAILIALAGGIIGSMLAKGEDFTNLTATAYGTYAPQLNKSGGGLALTYRTAEIATVNISTEIRLQYLNTATPWTKSTSDKLFVPSGMIVLSRPVQLGGWFKYWFASPLIEAGAAADMNCHPYAIIGGGGTAGYRRGNWSLAGTYLAESWSGPYNKFTAHQVGLTLGFKF